MSVLMMVVSAMVERVQLAASGGEWRGLTLTGGEFEGNHLAAVCRGGAKDGSHEGDLIERS